MFLINDYVTKKIKQLPIGDTFQRRNTRLIKHHMRRYLPKKRLIQILNVKKRTGKTNFWTRMFFNLAILLKTAETY